MRQSAKPYHNSRHSGDSRGGKEEFSSLKLEKNCIFYQICSPLSKKDEKSTISEVSFDVLIFNFAEKTCKIILHHVSYLKHFIIFRGLVKKYIIIKKFKNSFSKSGLFLLTFKPL